MKLPDEIESKIEELNSLCIKYRVKKLFVFGSIVKGNFNANTSDVDLIVEVENLPPEQKGEILMKLWTELELLFSRKVDLITNMNLRNPYLKKDIENSKILLYDRAG
jgi:predicted nucleotidyltransferase